MSIQTTTGIELYGDDLRIVVLAGLTRRIRVQSSVVLEGFASLDFHARREELARAIRTHRIPRSNVHLVLPGSFGTIRRLEVPSAAPDPEAVAALQLESLTPWPVEEIWWTIGLASSRRPGSGRGKWPLREAMVSIVHAEVVRPWVELFRTCGLPLAGLSLAPVAWADGLDRIFGSDRPAMALGVLPDRIEGALVSGDHAAVVTEETGALSSDPGSGKPDAIAVRRAVATLLGAVRVEDPDTVRLVVRGPVPADWEPIAVSALPLGPGPASETRNFGALAAALSAGRGRGSNLLPDAEREKRSVLRVAPTFALAACLLLALTALVVREPYQYLRYGERLDEEISRLAPLVDGVIAEDSQLVAAREAYAELNALLVADRNLEALSWLAESMPLDTWITSFRNENGVLTISGYSARTSDFQVLLDESELFESVELASPVTRDAADRERFTIRMNVGGTS